MFHVPNQFRVRSCPSVRALESNDSHGNNGAFVLRSPVSPDWDLFVIASDGGGWDHVSAQARKVLSADGHVAAIDMSGRVPTWDEMCFLKNTFWDPEDAVVQYHPPVSEYVNRHKFTLHLWRPTSPGVEIPRPPTYMV